MKCIAMASGKGGVGKTLLTASLGLTLSELGYSVLLLDGDMGLQGLDLPLGVVSHPRRTIGDLARGRCRLEDTVVSVRENLDFIPATGKGNWKDVSRQALLYLLEGVSIKYNFVLLDCPAGLGKGIHFAEQAADVWFLVMGASWASQRSALRTARFIKTKRSVFFILNDIQSNDAVLSVATVASALGGYPILGVLPHSEETDRLAQEGRLARWPESSAFRQAVRLLVDAFLKNTIYPMDRWQGFLRQSETRNRIIFDAVPVAPVTRLLYRQIHMGMRWKRR